MRILVVEDDPTTSALLEQAIREEGHSVVVETDGPSGLKTARFYEFDAIVLDVMLPGLDGFSLAKILRQEGRQTPILMLTARDADRDVVHGLNLGADDYLVKPFSLDIFFARLKAVVRRGTLPVLAKFSVADLAVDTGTREVLRAGKSVSLTRTEYSLLELLLRNGGRIVPREKIMEAVWGYGADVESNTLDAFVSSLRSKIDPPGTSRLIHTVRGVGYSLQEKE
jgi:DNA-binding response OmpR family regulator